MDIGLENAGAYLGDTFGPLMRVIWAVGLLAAGALRPSALPLSQLCHSGRHSRLSSSFDMRRPFPALPDLHCSTDACC